MDAERSILHVDMDAFFASVEQLDQPELRGKPVLVGGDGRRGVVAAASYEARVYGCRSAMPTATARRLCPHAVVVKPRGSRYRELSDRVFAIFERFTPLVQPLSIDEAFLDVTGSIRLLGEPEAQAREIKRLVTDETGLTASVGVAPNKFLAKLASDLDKPDGLVVIRRDRIHTTLDPLPVSKLWGVGAAAQKRLDALGLRTIGDVRRYPEDALVARFGDFGAHIARLARAQDDRPVVADREAKSVSHEQTFGENLGDPDEVRSVIMGQCEQVARRLRRHGRLARTVTVKIRFGDFETITRSDTLSEPTDATDDVWRAARALFDAWAARGFRPVRLIGVGVSHLLDPDEAAVQPGLFGRGEQAKRRAADLAADAVAQKYGKTAIRRAGSLGPGGSRGSYGPEGPGSPETGA